ncbi:GNAT family N-acetyltransferase [Brevibacillus nitrificans]|uniref:GNAT family N-acetyltransferase n=1 Tax=Brevibacillus nitrificans TaxID=651560 RepID=UPI002858066B|nr:GNAT family N-acetyltransferase [Brevibacillus nitrificans]MDR7314216.1 RimJ/RimL family protein N-acetyltransferase [Brevibacillus nitrificans]
MIVLETERLYLRHQTLDDAAFILELVNDPAWLQFIGDRGVRTLDDARSYIANGAIKSYERDGFGFYLVERKEDHTLLGMCGLVKREGLEDVDIGFAFLPDYRSKGYAYEAASAVMQYAKETLGLTRVVAITTQDNHSSGRLLEKLGLRFERLVQMPNDTELLRLFVYDASPASTTL